MLLQSQQKFFLKHPIAGDVFVFQQCNAPTHHAHNIVKLLCHEMPHSLILMWPANITDADTVDYYLLHFVMLLF